MTACHHVRAELGGYVLDALEPSEVEAVRRHLEDCPVCAAEHAGWQRLEVAQLHPLQDARAELGDRRDVLQGQPARLPSSP